MPTLRLGCDGKIARTREWRTSGRADTVGLTEGGTTFASTLPDGWKTPTSAEIEGAKRLALAAFKNARLDRYYDVNTDYAGATFATLGENPTDDIVASDLHAVTMLSVSVGPRATRRLLEPGPHRQAVRDALANPALGADTVLANATAADFEAMWELHLAVKAALSDPHSGSSNPWVTASKLTARKRPHLMPVRDNVVGKALGARALGSASIYWCLFHSLLNDEDVAKAMLRAREALASAKPEMLVDTSDVRLLDAALWMHRARS